MDKPSYPAIPMKETYVVKLKVLVHIPKGTRAPLSEIGAISVTNLIVATSPNEAVQLAQDEYGYASRLEDIRRI